MYLHALDFGAQVEFTMESLQVKEDVDGKPLPAWALYPAGVAWVLNNQGLSVMGVDAVYASELPIGAGLSSSAAVELAFAVMWQMLAGWKLNRMKLAQYCQMAENQYVGVNCGLMDQFASAHGVAQHALSFDTRNLTWKPLPLPCHTVVIIADSGVRRELSSSAYNQRRMACEKAVSLLKQQQPEIQSLRDVQPNELIEKSKLLPIEIFKRARHVVEEMARVNRAQTCLMQDDARTFGKIMLEGHASLRDLYEVSCPELDVLVEVANQHTACYGARLTGAGFGGCTVNLVKSDQAENFIAHLKAGYHQKTGRQAEVYFCQASRGAYCQKL